MRQNLKRDPTDTEVADNLGLTVKDIRKTRQEAVASWHTHIDSTMLERPTGDNMDDVNDYANVATKAFATSLDYLTGEELFVLVCVVYEEMKVADVAALMKATTSAVNAWLASAVLSCYTQIRTEVEQSAR